MAFEIKRGTNISEWLSQSSRRGLERLEFFTEKDVRLIAGLGFDHIRLPIDEEQLWDEAGQPDREAFHLLDSALDWCAAAGLRVVVDLHIVRSHHFNDRHVPRLFTDPAALARFVDLWRQLSAHLGPRPAEQVAYELLNEAVAPDPADWNRVAMAAYAAIREAEPERVIVLGSNHFNQCHTFHALEIPDDPHLILTFHFYHPMLVTHHRATWWGGGFWAGPISYPGAPIAPRHLKLLEDEFLRRTPGWDNRPYDRAAMEAQLAQPLAARGRTGLPLYCGEFGCYHKAPQSVRLAWYRDIVQVFKAQGIAWANWDYSGGFSPVVEKGRDTAIARVLLG